MRRVFSVVAGALLLVSVAMSQMIFCPPPSQNPVQTGNGYMLYVYYSSAVTAAMFTAYTGADPVVTNGMLYIPQQAGGGGGGGGGISNIVVNGVTGTLNQVGANLYSIVNLTAAQIGADPAGSAAVASNGAVAASGAALASSGMIWRTEWQQAAGASAEVARATANAANATGATHTAQIAALGAHAATQTNINGAVSSGMGALTNVTGSLTAHAADQTNVNTAVSAGLVALTNVTTALSTTQAMAKASLVAQTNINNSVSSGMGALTNATAALSATQALVKAALATQTNVNASVSAGMGALTNSIIASAAAVTNIYNVTKEPSGFADGTTDTIAFNFNTNSRVLTITNAAGPIVVYRRGAVLTNTTAAISFSAIGTNAGLWFIYWDGDTGAETISQTAWGLDDVQVATIEWNPANSNAVVSEETHGLMPWSVHRRFHLDPKLSAAWSSGLTVITNGATGFSMSTGTWMDEDISHVVASTQTRGLVAHRNGSAGARLAFRGPRTQYFITNAASTALQYDLNGTLTDVPSTGVNNYMSMWAYAVPFGWANGEACDIMWVVGRSVGSLATISAESPPDLSSVLPTAEAVLLYQFILRNPANVPTYVQATDFRAALVKGSTASVQSHATLTGRDLADQHPLSAITGYDQIMTNGGSGASLTGITAAQVGAITGANVSAITTYTSTNPVLTFSESAVAVAWVPTVSNATMYPTFSGPGAGLALSGMLRLVNTNNNTIVWPTNAVWYNTTTGSRTTTPPTLSVYNRIVVDYFDTMLTLGVVSTNATVVP